MVRLENVLGKYCYSKIILIQFLLELCGYKFSLTIRTSIAKKSYSFVIFQGGEFRPPVPHPTLDPHMY